MSSVKGSAAKFNTKRLPFGKQMSELDFNKALDGNREQRHRLYQILSQTGLLLADTTETAGAPVSPVTPGGGAADALVVPVGASGAGVGSLVNVAGLSMTLAGYNAKPATHVVIKVSNGLATCVVSVASVPVKIAGTVGASKVLLLYTNGNATADGTTIPPNSMVQEVGYARQAIGGSGFWDCSINIPNPRLV